MPSRRRVLAAALAAGPVQGTVQGPARAQGEAWPDRPVRFIVPFPPGQAADLLGRILAEELSKRWPQRVVVENRPGGAGAIGMEAIARAAPDGATFGIGTSGTLGVNPSVIARLPYDVARDFAPVTGIFTLPLLIVANPAFPPADIRALVAYVKANPGQQFASAGPATAQHMAAELFALRAGLRMAHVPYRGSGPAIADLIAGNVALMFDSSSSALPHVQSGRIRALAVTSTTRLPQLPEIPTVAETVIPGYEAAGWSGLVAPAGTPPGIIRRANADTVAVLRDAAVVRRINEMGAFPSPGSPQEFADFVRAEVAKWGEVARAANVRLEG